jgi:hypothetical protein
MEAGSMKARKARVENRALELVKQRFAHWRAHRASSRTAIPDRLWRAAARLIGPQTITEVARELGVEWRKLKQRAGNRSSRAKKTLNRPKKVTSFIELTPPAVKAPDLMGIEALPSSGALEIIRVDGARIVLQPYAVAKVDVPALLRQFLSAAER